MTAEEREWLAKRFEENRVHLRAVGYRMRGSVSDADDAGQKFWLHPSGGRPALARFECPLQRRFPPVAT